MSIKLGTEIAKVVISGIALVVAVAAPAFAAPPAGPPGKLSPDDIQKTFFTGQPFVAASPSNVKFKMTFTADGKIKRVPMGKGSRSEGNWTLSKEGFCRSWKNTKEECFTVVSAGSNKWSVLKGTTIMATWSK
jgi:hypothetical protein